MGIAETFKVLSDPQRREILEILKNGRRNAGELAEMLGISSPALSYHLKLLKGAELVLEYKDKNYIYYEMNATVFDEIVLWVRQFSGRNEDEDKNSRSRNNTEQDNNDTGTDHDSDCGCQPDYGKE